MRRILALLVSVVLVLGLFPATSSATITTAAYTPPAIKVAVLRSSLTHEWQLRHNKGWSTLITQEVTANYLKSRGWNVTLINDSALSDLATLKKYDVIVMPWVFAMNIKPSKTLLRYVGEGGAVVASIGAPRVAPEVEPNPSNPNEVEPEHFYWYYKHRAWEWGPMSEAYQTEFVNDVGRAGVTFSPGSLTNPIVVGARKILSARGADANHLNMAFPAPDWVELPKLLPNNRNTSVVMKQTFTSKPTMSPAYPGTHPAVVSSKYGLGRTVYFYFSITAFLPGYKFGKDPHMGDLGGAYLESSIAWAAQSGSLGARINRTATTHGNITAARDGIYVSQNIGDIGNVPVGGNVTARIWDPSGRLVYNKTRYKVGLRPTQTAAFNNVYVPGSLKTGKYRVQVEYASNYTYSATWKESAWVSAGQGRGLSTLVEGAAAPYVSRRSFSPTILSPNGDGWGEYGYVNYTLDRPASVSVHVKDAYGRVVATLASSQRRGSGAHSARFTPRRSDGSPLPNGVYRYTVTARNTAGKRSSTGVLFVSRNLGKAPALGTSPALSSVSPAPSPFSPNGDGIADKATFKYTLSSNAWVSIRLFNSNGEVKTVLNNVKRLKGARGDTWTGRDNAGRTVPNGSYRYYVFASSGGSSPKTALATGLVKVQR